MRRADRIQTMGQEVGDRLRDTVDEIKPRLRGWLHTVTVPLSLAAGIVLVALSPHGEARLGSVVFAVTSVLLFSVSAIYHTPAWGARVHGVLQRIDHANIFLLIAGTYTPFALLLLDDRNAQVLLTIVWVGAVLGVAFRALWTGAPRWLYVPLYLVLGWSAAFWAADFAASANAAVLTLMVVGGLLYSLGGLVYGLKKPDPLPHWFGFHEVFHALTIAAFTVHYVGISIATYTV